MVTQRPAAITKEALSQASTYIIHNVMQTRDLIAIKDQISYGTDKERIDKLVDGIAFAQSRECIIYSPEFLKDDGFLWIGKIRGDRRTEHKGKNIEVKPQKDLGMHTAYDVVESPTMEAEQHDFTQSYNTFSTEVAPVESSRDSTLSVRSGLDDSLNNRRQFNLVSACGGKEIVNRRFRFKFLYVRSRLNRWFLSHDGRITRTFPR